MSEALDFYYRKLEEIVVRDYEYSLLHHYPASLRKVRDAGPYDWDSANVGDFIRAMLELNSHEDARLFLQGFMEYTETMNQRYPEISIGISALERVRAQIDYVFGKQILPAKKAMLVKAWEEL